MTMIEKMTQKIFRAISKELPVEDYDNAVEALNRMESMIRDMQCENKRLMCFRKFYFHIRRELDEIALLKNNPKAMRREVCCEICGKTFEEITGMPE